MYGFDILCEVTKVAFEIPHQNILPIPWKMCILFAGDNLRAFRFKSL